MSTSVTASSQLFEKLHRSKSFTDRLVSGAIGFVMSGASIMLTAAPFGIAWASSSPPQTLLSSCAGTALGYLFLLSGDISVRYIACVAVFLALRWVFSFVTDNGMTLLSPFLAGSTVAATGLAIAVADKSSRYGIIMVVCETAVTVTASMLFHKTRISFREGACLTRSNSVCTGILLCALYMGLGSFSLWGISLSHAFACAVILCCGFYASAGVSSAAAVAAGLSAAAAGDPYMLACYCAGGLACGIFSPLGKGGSCCAFSAAASLTYCAQMGFKGLHIIFLECMLGCAATCLLPSSILKKLGFSAVSDCAEGEMLRRVVISQLSRIKDALSDISAVTEEVSQKLSQIGSDPIETIFAKSCSAVCKGCKNSPKCWQTGYDNTADALNHAFNAAKANGAAKRSDLPPHFECERIDKMLAAINDQTTGYMARRIERRHFAQLRSVSSDQFGGIGDLLTAMQNELERFCCAPSKTAEAVSKYIDSLDCSQSSVCCYLDSGQRVNILVELPPYKTPRLLTPSVTADLSEIVMQELSAPEHTPDGAVSRVFWSAKTLYGIESAFFQSAAGHNRFCGDSCKVINSANDRAIMLLSDGMGIGSPAAVDATLTTSLLERLLKAGADLPSSLRLVNAALLSGGGEERLCTVDAAILDLYNCRLDIYKAGAAPTFLYRHKRCCTVEAQSLPAGILGGAEAKRTSVTLSEGDIIVMLSDGVIETGSEWIPSQIAALADGSLDELCKNLIATAHDRRLTDREDDMTVMAARILSA